MFVLSELKYTVRIPPWMFETKLMDALVKEINKKLANKVVMRVGLCIMLFDITKIGEAFILPGDGAFHTRVHFRALVFHPRVDEILVGKIRACSREGIHGLLDAALLPFYRAFEKETRYIKPSHASRKVSMEFFDDIMIVPEGLQHPSRFDETEQLWIWEYATEEGKHDLFMELGEMIRFRVMAEVFRDVTPLLADGSVPVGTNKDESRVPYCIIGTINEPGLGLLTWWSNQ